MNKSRMWFGVSLIVLGVLFLLDTMGVMDFGTLFRDFWPLLLVLWGVFMIFRRRPSASGPSGHDWDQAFGDVDASVSADTLHHANVFGDLTVRVTSKAFQGGEVSTVFGDMVLDLHECALADGEQRLKLHGVFGDCSIRIPANTPYALSANTVFGSLRTPDQQKGGVGSNLDYDSPGYASAGKRLRISASQVFGDIHVEA